MSTETIYGPGSELRNGATVVHATRRRDDWIVLALWHGAEYVTWIVGNDGHACCGHYHQDDFKSACDDYFERTGV